MAERHHGLVDQPALVGAIVEYSNTHSIPLFPPFASLHELAIGGRSLSTGHWREKNRDATNARYSDFYKSI
jgi:hypothetical protein